MRDEVTRNFCMDQQCDYYRRSENIYSDLDPYEREKINEHYAIQHIMW